MSQRAKPVYKHPKTPDPRVKASPQEDSKELVNLHQRPCKFWGVGKCNWGWGCRFLHGNSFADDPRRPEYRGPAVDFTVFPRPIISSPAFSSSPPMHTDDQTRVKTLRSPVAEIIMSNSNLALTFNSVKESLLANGVDLFIQKEPLIMALQDARTRLEKHFSDYLIYIDVSGIVVFPEIDTANVTLLPLLLTRHWSSLNNNLSIEQTELMTAPEIIAIISKLTRLESIDGTISSFQDETSKAIVSHSTESCKFTEAMIENLKERMGVFFSKLSSANSMISDMPVFASDSHRQGRLIPHPSSVPIIGLSIFLQRTLLNVTARGLTQIHMCLSHVNKMIGKQQSSNSCYTTPSLTSSCMHPISLIAPVVNSLCSDDKILLTEGGKSIEPDVSVDMGTHYTVSFRDPYRSGYNQFGPNH